MTHGLIAETRVETVRASKYLKWLCGHFRIKVPAEYDDWRGSVQFPFGACEMQVQEDALFIRVTAADDESFARVKYVVSDHLERFGRKDAIRVTWADQ